MEQNNTEEDNKVKQNDVQKSTEKNDKTRTLKMLVVLCSVILVLLVGVLVVLFSILNGDDNNKSAETNNEVNIETESEQTESEETVVQEENKEVNREDKDDIDDYAEYLEYTLETALPRDNNMLSYAMNFKNFSTDLVFSDIVVEITVLDENMNVINVQTVKDDVGEVINPTETKMLRFTIPDTDGSQSFDMKVVDFSVNEIDNNEDNPIYYGIDDDIQITNITAESRVTSAMYLVEYTNFSTDKMYSNFIINIIQYDRNGNPIGEQKQVTYDINVVNPGESVEFYYSADLNLDTESFEIQLINSKIEKIK